MTTYKKLYPVTALTNFEISSCSYAGSENYVYISMAVTEKASTQNSIYGFRIGKHATISYLETPQEWKSGDSIDLDPDGRFELTLNYTVPDKTLVVKNGLIAEITAPYPGFPDGGGNDILLNYILKPDKLTIKSFPSYYLVRTSRWNYAGMVVTQTGTSVYVRWVTYQLQHQLAWANGGGGLPPDLVISPVGGVYLSVPDLLTSGSQLHALGRRAVRGELSLFDKIDDAGTTTAIGDPGKSYQQIQMIGDLLFVLDQGDMTEPPQLHVFNITTKARYEVSLSDTVPRGPELSDLKNPKGLLVRLNAAKDISKVEVLISDEWGTAMPARTGRISFFTINLTNLNKITCEKSVMLLPKAAENLQEAIGMLTWADEQQSAFYFVKSTARELYRAQLKPQPMGPPLVDYFKLLGKDAMGKDLLPEKMVKIAVVSSTRLILASQKEIGEVLLENSDPGDDVFLVRIGYVPFSSIINDVTKTATVGRANVPTGYFFQVQNLPFGDTVKLHLNHRAARQKGAVWYSVKLIWVKPAGDDREVIVKDPFTDLKWLSNAAGGAFQAVATTPDPDGKYPVRDVEGDVWMEPYLAAYIDTTKVMNGLHKLVVTFYDSGKNQIADAVIAATKLNSMIYVDNYRSRCYIDEAKIVPPDSGRKCGCLFYRADPMTKQPLGDFKFDFFHHHPSGNAKYFLHIYEGNNLKDTVSAAADPTGKTEPYQLAVRTLLGTCPAALVSVNLVIDVPVTNGTAVYSHGARTLLYFAVAPEA